MEATSSSEMFGLLLATRRYIVVNRTVMTKVNPARALEAFSDIGGTVVELEGSTL